MIPLKDLNFDTPQEDKIAQYFDKKFQIRLQEETQNYKTKLKVKFKNQNTISLKNTF